jgi:hypothetical protein
VRFICGLSGREKVGERLQEMAGGTTADEDFLGDWQECPGEI